MSVPPPAMSPASISRRFDLVDLARGLALLAMAVFHFAYDLSFFGLIETDVPADPAWRLFARCIAASFLLLSGLSLVLATRNGLDRRAFSIRVAKVAAAAALVTVGTRLAMPDSFIFFGILHHLAVASLLALLFLRLPAAALAFAAAIVLALPRFAMPAMLDQPWLLWLGFARSIPPTADFVPLFPWFGCVLAGMALGKFALPSLATASWPAWRARSWPSRLVVIGGRNSLIVYLVHQPLLIGAIMLALQIAAPAPSEERSFMQSCQRSCTGGRADAAACERLCACMVDSLKRESLWARPPAEVDRRRIDDLTRSCAPRTP